MRNKVVKIIAGFIILISIQYICFQIIKITNIFLPAPVLGLVLLVFLLEFKIIKKEYIKDICNILLKYMSVLFIPFLVGIISHYKLIKDNLTGLLLLVFLTTTITLIITAFFVESIIKFERLRKIRKLKNE